MKTGLITGISGQGGAYLAKSLLDNDYQVIGTTRDRRQTNTGSLKNLGILDQLTLLSLDMQNSQSVLDLIDQLRPDEIYHLAAPSSVARSFQEPSQTIYSIVLTTVNLLEAVRKTDVNIPCFIATSTEMFGDCAHPANVDSPHNPRSPYGIGKSCAHYQTRNYREAYDLFACSGVLSNFESPLRPRNYVTTKIVGTACKIALGEVSQIELGNLSIRRDWGSAVEFMNAARLCLQQEQPNDYIIATGVTSSLKDFLKITFSCLDMDYEQYLVSKNSLLRPLDIKQTKCDVSDTRTKLGWEAKMSLEQVISEMIYAELVSSVGDTKARSLLKTNSDNVFRLSDISTH